MEKEGRGVLEEGKMRIDVSCLTVGSRWDGDSGMKRMNRKRGEENICCESVENG